MKKLCLLLLALMPFLFSSPALAQTEGDFAYSISDGQATITAYTGSAAELTLPDTLGGCPVTAIRYCAFRDCKTLAQLVIPEGIVSIGSNAFAGCTSLSQVSLPESLRLIGSHAFYGCCALTQITLNDGVQRLHPYAFYGCSAVRLCALDSRVAAVLTDYGYTFTSPEFPELSFYAYDTNGQRTFIVADCRDDAVRVALPQGVTAIGDYAFFGCASLSEIILPQSVAQIGHSAFEGCTSLAQITLPAGVQRIEGSAFSGCAGLLIIAPPDSAAQAFAQSGGFAWQAP